MGLKNRVLGSFFRGATLVMVAFVLAGCGDEGTPAEGPAPDPNQIAQADLKKRLEYIAESGTAGSALAGMREALKATGHEDMVPQVDRMQNSKRPDEVKRIAKSMAAKL